MKPFVFYQIESKINDFLIFPEIVQIKDWSEMQDSNYSDLVASDVKDFFLMAKGDLEPFLTRIKKFYFEAFSMTHFFRCAYPFFGYESPLSYLKALGELNENQIRGTILAYLEKQETFEPFTDDSYLEVQKYIEQPSLMTEFIDQMRAEDEEKWKLMTLVRKPVESMREWLDLLIEIEPIFEKYYGPNAQKIEAYGLDLATRLNADTEGTLHEITDGMMTSDLLLSGDLFVSLVNMTGIMISANDRRPVCSWGLEAEATIKRIQEIQKENQLDRVITFKNLGDKTRYEVLVCISEGMQSIKDIASKLNVSSATISYHVNNLTTGKLIKIVHEGDKKYIYKVNEDWLEQCFSDLKKDLHITQS